MKPGFTTFTCPGWTLEQIAQHGSRLGYQGVCFRCGAGQSHGVEITLLPGERRAVRRLLEKHRLEVCCLATPLRMNQQADLYRVQAFLELAADLGCPGIQVFSGSRPPYALPEELIRLVGAHLRDVEHLLTDYHVEIWLATHDSLSQVAAAAQAVQQAGHPMVGLSWDIAQTLRKGETLQQARACLSADLVRHVLLNDALADPHHCVIRPLGQGELPVDAAAATLARLSYPGYICGQWFVDPRDDKPLDLLARYQEDLTRLILSHNHAADASPR